MRKIKTESTGVAENTVVSKGNRTPLIIMGVIVLIAAFVRVAFSVVTSVDSGFALSGGSVSTNNLYILSELVANGTIVLVDGSLYYPYGSVSTAPFLFTLLMYPFAALVNLFVEDPILASSAVLAASAPVFAVAAVVVSYFLGKQILKSKLAGYLTALFVALCPIFVKESVFSNGTGTSFILFLLVLCIYFLFKAIESVGYKEGDEVTRKKAYGFSAISGVLLALVAITWADYRAILLPILVVMVVQVLVDRFKGKDPMPMALVYTITVMIAAVAAAAYYGALGLWDAVASGSVFLAVFISALVAGFAAFGKKPWTLTLPITLVVAIVVLVVIAIVMPDFYHIILAGNPIFDEAYLATLGDRKLNLSTLSTYYGAITYWFVYLAFLGYLYRFRANAGSAPYVFTMVWTFVLTLTCGHDATQAAIATPVFAIGFAAVVCWILKHVDFKAYFSAIRTASGGKLKLRRVIKPAPFVSIVLALLLVVGPNVTYVLDASISSNDVDDYNDSVSSLIDREPFGALSYYVKTDESWTVRDALKDIAVTDDGALITWMDYSSDAPLYAGLNSYTDSNGHGMVDVSNILLANAVTGASAAAILLDAIIYLGGMTDDVKNAFTAAGLGTAIADIEKVLDDVDNKLVDGGKSIRYMVTTDVETYGKVSEDISDENIQYLFITNYLAENYSQYAINKAYDTLASQKQLATPYVMVTGDMMPFYYGYNGVFNEMAMLNGYNVNSSNYTVDKFTMFGIDAYYYGVYGFTDAMCDSLLYRTYIGMSPAEAGYSSIYYYMEALANADASVVMQPGYGLSNYEVVYWQVMYNPADDADADSDGWKQMGAQAAIDLQKEQGGRINYLSGLPVIVKYNANESTPVTGVVTGADAGEVRISAYDENGKLCGTTFTNAAGEFQLNVVDTAKTTLVYYAGFEGLTGGIIIGTCAANAVTSVPVPVGEITLVPKDNNGTDLGLSNLDVTITNTVTDEELDYTGDDMGLSVGTYDVKVERDGTSVYSGTVTVTGDMTVVMYIDSYEYTLTIKDEFGKPISDKAITVIGDVTSSTETTVADGKAVFNLPKGSYTVSAEGLYFESPTFSVSSNGSKEFTASKGMTLEDVGTSGVIYYFVSDVYNTSIMGTSDVTLPISSFGKTTYTCYYLSEGKVHYGTFNNETSRVDFINLPTFKDGVTARDFESTLKNSNGTTVSGTVTLYTADGAMFRATAGSDGKFAFYGIPNVEMAIYATNGSTEAYFGPLTIGDVPSEITMSPAKSFSPSVEWDSIDFKYLDVNVKMTVDTDIYNTFFAVNTSGTYKIVIPDGANVDVDVTINAPMYFKLETGAGVTKSVELTYAGSAPTYVVYALTSADAGVATIDKNSKVVLDNDLEAKESAIDDSYVFEIGADVDTIADAVAGFVPSKSISYVLGKIGTGTDASTDYYAKGTYIYNPLESYDSGVFKIELSELLGFSTASAAVDAISYYRVYVDLDDGESVTLDGTKDKDYIEGNSGATDGKEYLIPKGKTTYAVLKNSDGSKIQYAKIDPSGIAAKDLRDKVTVSGYVGSDVDGDMKVTVTDVTFIVDVKDGSYSVDLPQSVDVEFNIDFVDAGITYSGGVTKTGGFGADDKTYNFVVGGVGPNSVVDVTPSGTDVYKSLDIDDLEFKNVGDSGYFTIKFGDAWESAVAFDSTGITVIDRIYVASGDTVKFDVTGYYNSERYNVGSEAMAITLDGSYDYVISFKDSASPVSGGQIFVNKLDDEVSDHAYTYILEVNNMLGHAQDFNVSGWQIPAGWKAMIEVKAYGITIKTMDISSGVGGAVTAYPGITTFRLSYMPVDDAIDVPKLTLENVFALNTGEIVSTLTSEFVEINGGTVTIEADPESAKVSATDMNASGRGVFNEPGDIPTIVWVLFALAIILAILSVWMASKRGVFARKK